IIVSLLNKYIYCYFFYFFFQAEDGIRDRNVTGVQTCALPISCAIAGSASTIVATIIKPPRAIFFLMATTSIIIFRAGLELPLTRSEEHTSELQSRFDLVCRLLLEKKNFRYN